MDNRGTKKPLGLLAMPTRRFARTEQMMLVKLGQIGGGAMVKLEKLV